MLRRALLAASASTRMRELITTMPVTRDVVARFVAGDTAEQAMGVIERLLADGLLASIDYLGEDTTDRQQATAVTDEYVRLLARLGQTQLAAGGRAEVSVKPTSAPSSVTGSPCTGSRSSLPSRCSSTSRRGGCPRLCTRATVSWPR